MKEENNFDNDDVIITEHNEQFFFWQAKKYNLKIIRKATNKEAVEYREEYAYWQKEENRKYSSSKLS